MTWTLSASGTTTTVPSATTLTTNGTTAAGNPTLHFASGAGSLAAGQIITDATAPTVIPLNTTVVSATSTSVTMSANATGAGVGGTDSITFSNEMLLATDTTNATYVVEWDCNALAAGEPIELRAYTTALSGGVSRQIWKGTYTGGQFVNPIVQTPAIPSDIEVHITLKQLSGSARAIPWKLLRV